MATTMTTHCDAESLLMLPSVESLLACRGMSFMRRSAAAPTSSLRWNDARCFLLDDVSCDVLWLLRDIPISAAIVRL